MKEPIYFVYMLASRCNGTLYTGVTNNVLRRTWQHKSNLVAGFTKKHGVHILVWHELHTGIREAIAREKQIKGWNPAWKIRLIEKDNSGRNDLYVRLLGETALPETPGSPSLAHAHDARRGDTTSPEAHEIEHAGVGLR